MRRKSRFGLILVGILLSACAAAADRFDMDINPVFSGYRPGAGTIPFSVDIKNNGADARGVLKVSTDSFQMDYPVDLPRGAEKRILVYPTVNYAEPQFFLITNQGQVNRKYVFTGGFSADETSVLLISESPGEMAFLRQVPFTPQPNTSKPRPAEKMIQDAYVKPADAPDRPVAYQGIGAIVLGNGAERLSQEQVSAISRWVLTGGTLLFVGGPSAPVLTDPRWAKFLPVRDFEVRTLRGSNLGGALDDPAPTVSVLSGKPVSGASAVRDGDVVLSAERKFGVGKIAYISYNPFEAPLDTWPGRRDPFVRTLRLTDRIEVNNFLQGVNQDNTQYGSGLRTSSGSPAFGGQNAQDPFSVKLMPPTNMMALLGIYFFLVVPVNFLVLKKLKRGELAWITAPILAFAFAGILFNTAQSLYAASMASISSGALIGQSGYADGVIVARSQIFIPRSGVYDLKLQDVDSIGESASVQGYSPPNREEFDAVDTGQVLAPSYRANNLAFLSLNYRQNVPVGQWFSVKLERMSQSKWRVVARNTGSVQLKDAKIWVGNSVQDIDDMAPGQSRSIEVDRTTLSRASAPGKGGSWIPALARTNAVALTGTITGFRPGPQIGTDIAERSNIDLTMIGEGAVGKL